MYSESQSQGSLSSEPDCFRLMEKAVRRFLIAKGKGRGEDANATGRRKRHRNQKNEGMRAVAEHGACDIDNSTFVDVRRPDPRARPISPGVFLLDAPGLPSGLYIIKRALDREEELELARKCLEEFSTMDHTNLTNLRSLRRRQAEDRGESVEAALADVPDSTSLWRESIAKNDNFKSFQYLRWASLGYHYDWTSRCYYEDMKSPFPTKLADLCSSLAAAVGCSLVPEAAIVNYYPSGSTMGGHLDDAELTMDHPIVSISMGRSAIFLMGSRTKNVVPVPILVQGGDVVIMSGESRYCYHGVPHILTSLEEDAVFDEVENNGATVCYAKEDRDHKRDITTSITAHLDKNDAYARVAEYLSSCRLNINVRQVVSQGGVWESKCGVGAMQMSATKPPEFKLV